MKCLTEITRGQAFSRVADDRGSVSVEHVSATADADDLIILVKYKCNRIANISVRYRVMADHIIRANMLIYIQVGIFWIPFAKIMTTVGCIYITERITKPDTSARLNDGIRWIKN